MIKFTDAQMLGAQDKKFQGQYNYLLELLSTFLTRGTLSSVSGDTSINLKTGEITKDGEVVSTEDFVREYAEHTITKTETPPDDPDDYDLWIDSSTGELVWYMYKDGAWQKLTRTSFTEIDGELVGSQIEDGAITNSKISSGEITEAKVNWKTHLLF